MTSRPLLVRSVMAMTETVPLLRAATLQGLVETHAEARAAATVLTARMPDPTGYGRIQRDASGRVTSIVEQKDLAEGQGGDEINTGTFLFDAKALLAQLDKLKTDNAQGEYYLTDVVQLLCEGGQTVAASVCRDHREVLGINNRRQLAVAERRARRRICDFLMNEVGVTITDPRTTYIEAGARVGRDTVIYPCTVVRAGVEIGERCEIGPFAHLRSGTRIGNG
jgi:bifunctional UDP-N-acetylglucosamine pyrophosphorylase/glucosamine-1-phosphate N-acetyltransferase